MGQLAFIHMHFYIHTYVTYICMKRAGQLFFLLYAAIHVTVSYHRGLSAAKHLHFIPKSLSYGCDVRCMLSLTSICVK